MFLNNWFISSIKDKKNFSSLSAYKLGNKKKKEY